MRWRLEARWMAGAILIAGLQCALFLVLALRPGSVAIYLWLIGPRVLALFAGLVLVAGLLASWARPPFRIRRHGPAGALAITTIIVSLTAYRTYPSSHDREVSPVRFRLPLDGLVNVAWGGGTPSVNDHAQFPDQRWAYDLIVRRGGLRHRRRGERLEDYYDYGLPVLAPADGIVRSAVDGEPDKPIGVRWAGGDPAGNHVVLEVAPRQFLFLGHLERGSVRVALGDSVRAGQAVGRVGNSGRTQVPHLHIHLQACPTLGFGEGIPLYFYDYRCSGRVIERGIPTGGASEQVVENLRE